MVFFSFWQVLKGGGAHKARSLPEIVDMESVSGVSTRTEPTVSAVESSACQVRKPGQGAHKLLSGRLMSLASLPGG